MKPNHFPLRYVYKSGIMIFMLVCAFSIQSTGQQLRKLQNDYYTYGEKITYRVFYDAFLTGKVVAGEASLEIKPDPVMISGRPSMHVVGLGRTKGVFNLFFKVVNRYETFIDQEAIAPFLFIRRVNEGGYIINQDVTFNQFQNIARSNKATVKTPPYIQDIISAFYYARTIDFKDAKIGDVFPVDFFLDDSVYVTRIQYAGREIIHTKLGTFSTHKFKPMVLKGTVFSQPYPMTVWISDDKNRVPLLVESGILVGSVKMELIDYTGLKNPMESKIERKR